MDKFPQGAFHVHFPLGLAAGRNHPRSCFCYANRPEKAKSTKLKLCVNRQLSPFYPGTLCPHSGRIGLAFSVACNLAHRHPHLGPASSRHGTTIQCPKGALQNVPGPGCRLAWGNNVGRAADRGTPRAKATLRAYNSGMPLTAEALLAWRRRPSRWNHAPARMNTGAVAWGRGRARLPDDPG
jgi:hypothetical protein